MEKKKYKIKFIVTTIIVILIAVGISGGIILAKANVVNKEIVRIEEANANKYKFNGLKHLSFLSKNDLGKYKKQIINACEAYNLKGISDISVLSKTVKFDKATNIYEWQIACNDKRNAKFTSSFKKNTHVFVSSLNNINEDKQDKIINSDEKEKITVCDIDKFDVPDDCEFIKTEEDKNRILRELREYLALEEISSVGSVSFSRYLNKEKTRLEFNALRTAPIYIEKITMTFNSGGNVVFETDMETSEEKEEGEDSNE